MINIQGLIKRFPGQTSPALNDVTFSVSKGDFIVISGANGSGKSVLMNLIAGLDEANSGSVNIGMINGKKPRVGLVFQDADSQILGDTPEEDVSFGPKNLGYNKTKCAEISSNVLERVGLTAKKKSPARSLSGGEKRRLAVAGILAMDTDIIIFDEPYANLDWPGIIQVNNIISMLKKDGKTLIILTHELEKVLAMANRLIILFQGTIVFNGTPNQGLSTNRLNEWGIRNPLQNYTNYSDLIWKETV